MSLEEKWILSQHPCFNSAVERWFDRYPLAVAAGCNIRCHYCSRVYDCTNDNLPGRVSKTLSAREAFKKLHNAQRQSERIRVVCFNGPGEPLANKETLDTLERVHNHFPQLLKCVSTNGLLLEDYAEKLYAVGVRAVTVTVNAVDPALGRKIYGWVFYNNQPYRGISAAELLLNKQLAGMREARKKGILIKVNTVLIPGLNEEHLKEVALVVKQAGAYTMKVIPFIPQAELAQLPATSGKMLHQVKRELSTIIRQTI